MDFSSGFRLLIINLSIAFGLGEARLSRVFSLSPDLFLLAPVLSVIHPRHLVLGYLILRFWPTFHTRFSEIGRDS